MPLATQSTRSTDFWTLGIVRAERMSESAVAESQPVACHPRVQHSFCASAVLAQSDIESTGRPGRDLIAWTKAKRRLSGYSLCRMFDAALSRSLRAHPPNAGRGEWASPRNSEEQDVEHQPE